MPPIHWPRADPQESARRASSRTWVPSPCPRARMLPTESHARASSSDTRQYSNTPRPIPPCSAGIVRPNQPFSAIAAISERGISAFCGSSSSANGITTSRAKARASAWRAARASVRHGDSNRGGVGAWRSGLCDGVGNWIPRMNLTRPRPPNWNAGRPGTMIPQAPRDRSRHFATRSRAFSSAAASGNSGSGEASTSRCAMPLRPVQNISARR